MKKSDEEVERIVKEWFTGGASHEWRRLRQSPYHQIEFMITTYFLKKYLPKHGLVLDAGAGPGRYSIELVRQDYNVAVLDLVPEMLRLAKKKAKQAGVFGKISQFIEGSIEDLSMFTDETFDSVLCLGGALNHLLGTKQRERAAGELVRVAKKDAPVLVSVISRIGLLKSMLTRFPDEMEYAEHHWKVGNYIPGFQGKGFTAAHWFLPEELQALFEGQGLRIIETAGLEGLSSHHEKETNKLYKDQEKWKTWTEILLQTCTHPSVVGSCEHFLLIGRKKH
jgi:SAM-dependent methyltransferase